MLDKKLVINEWRRYQKDRRYQMTDANVFRCCFNLSDEPSVVGVLRFLNESLELRRLGRSRLSAVTVPRDFIGGYTPNEEGKSLRLSLFDEEEMQLDYIWITFRDSVTFEAALEALREFLRARALYLTPPTLLSSSSSTNENEAEEDLHQNA